MKGQKCSGGKHSKTQLTGMAGGNGAREKLPMLVIGRSAEDGEADDDFSEEPPIFEIASDTERAVQILSQLTLFCDKEEEMYSIYKCTE